MTIKYAVMSSDDNPDYIGYWPAVATAWKKIGIEPVLAYVGDPENINSLEPFGKVYTAKTGSMPVCNQAKIARWALAAAYADSVCVLTDVDMLPLSSRYFFDLGARYVDGKILFSSSDAYVGDVDRYPVCYTVATGSVLRDIFDLNSYIPGNTPRGWTGHPRTSDDNPLRLPFSDESLLKYLLIKRLICTDDIICLKRGWKDGIADSRIDRARWVVDLDKLERGEYIDAHLPRPLNLQMAEGLLSWIS